MNYYGGKTFMMPHLNESFNFRKYKMIHEPFAGGASFFFQANISPTCGCFLNDLDTYVTEIYEDMKRGQEFVNDVLSHIDKDDCRTYYKNRFKLNPAQRYIYFTSSPSSYINHELKFFNVSIPLLKKDVKRVVHYMPTISNVDAIWYIESHKDVKNELFFIDSPYPNAKQNYKQKFAGERFNTMLRNLEVVNFDFICTVYDFKGSNIKNCPFRVEEYQVKSPVAKKSLSKTELIITNIERDVKQLEMLC